MAEIIFFGMAMTLVQLGGAYLRYLPFSRELSKQDVADLTNIFLIWSILGFALNVFFAANGVNYRAYRLAFGFGWFPYFLLSMMVIRSRTAQHIFVFGMQSLWCFMLHSLAGMGVALIFGTMTEKFIPFQLTFYLLLFATLLKVERKLFTRLLPASNLFENNSIKWYISILPVAIFIGTVIQISEITFVSTWHARFSRLCFPIFFLLMYRAISISTNQLAEVQHQEQRTSFLNRQMESLCEQNALMQKSQQEVSALRQDLDKNYCTIDGLLEAGQVSEAMAYIKQQADLLDTTTVKAFCLAPLINAAFAIYFKRAEAIGIKVTHKIDLPAQLSIDESDLAVLLSNLLENAIDASKQQKPTARELSVILRYEGRQYVLEIANRYDFRINFGDNGLPYTSKLGHGLGMSSLESFAKKYDAYIDFSQKGNRVCLSMYWND